MANELKYGLYRGKWLVNDCNDAGILEVLKQNHAVEQTKKNRRYWVFENEPDFRNVQSLLDSAGYTPYIAEKPSPSPAAVPPQEALLKISATHAPTPAPSPNHFSIAYVPPIENGEITLTVPQIGEKIKQTIQSVYGNTPFWIRGEIAGFKAPVSTSSGHRYFSIVEENDDVPGNLTKKKNTKNIYTINAIIWKNDWQAILENTPDLEELKDGVKIRAFGFIQYYAAKSEITFYIKKIDPYFAEGEFHKKREKIGRYLRNQGIFDQNKNLPMPPLPLRIALFSNENAAGFRDFMQKLTDSQFPFRITLFRVPVQGAAMEQGFKKLFGMFESLGFDNFDVAVIIRGGGSVTDLDGFNNYFIAEWVARAPIKFIVGIGHDKDHGILDDITERATTPTDAAIKLVNLVQAQKIRLENAAISLERLALQKKTEQESRLNLIAQNLVRIAENKKSDAHFTLSQYSGRLAALANEKCLRLELTLKENEQKLRSNAHQILEKQQYIVRSQIERLIQAPKTTLFQAFERVESMCKDLCRNSQSAQDKLELKLARWETLIQSNDPNALFQKGYAFVRSANGTLLRSTADANPGDAIQIRMIDGNIDANITKIQRT